MLPRLKMIRRFFYLISCAFSCHKNFFFFNWSSRLIGLVQKKWNELDIFFKKFHQSPYFGKEKLRVCFLLQSLVACLSKQHFANLLSRYMRPFPKTLMKDSWNSNFLKFNFTKRVGRFHKKKEALNMWAVFGWKKTYHQSFCSIISHPCLK